MLSPFTRTVIWWLAVSGLTAVATPALAAKPAPAAREADDAVAVEYPRWVPSVGITGGLSGRVSAAQGGGAEGSVGARAGLDYELSPEVAWINGAMLDAAIVPDPGVRSARLRSGIRWSFVEWAYVGAAAFFEFLPQVAPGVEPFAGIQLNMDSVHLYVEAAAPLRPTVEAPDPKVDLTVEAGIRFSF